MATIHLRQDKERPLTIEEVDHNFDAINREVNTKLDAVEFNATNILEILDGRAGADSTLDADKVHGKYPNTEALPNTVVIRDNLGNVKANQFYGLHIGNVIGNIVGNGTGTWTGNATNVDGVVQLDHGGTGASTAPLARSNLGLGSISTQNKNTIDITGGTIVGITDLAIADGGTGASNASGARSNLGLVIGTDVQAYAAILSGVSSTSGDGFLSRTSTNSSAARTLSPGNSIEITNGNGKDGNPTIALTLNPTVSSLTKTGTNGAGDIGQSANRFNAAYINNTYVSTTNTTSIVKTGSDGSGDIGQINNKFAAIYGNRVLVGNGSASAPSFGFATDGAIDTGFYWGGDGYINLANNGAYAGQFQPGGNLVMVGNVTAYSDISIKENIETITSALETVKKLRGVNYKRKDTGELGTGLIAQETLSAAPRLVHKNTDGKLSIAYGNAVGILVEAVKELSEMVEDLNKRVK